MAVVANPFQRTMSKRRKIARKVGDIISIPLGDGAFAFAQVLPEPLIAFYDLKSSVIPAIRDIVSSPIAFVVFVMNHPLTGGEWPVIDTVPIDEEQYIEPLFFKRDRISGRLSIYRDSTGEEIPATPAQCEELEAAAVWDPQHIVDRLRDHFAGRPNKWVESLSRQNQF